MAKILAVSQDFTKKSDNHMNSLSINEAIEVFQKFGNERAMSICFHNRGCLKAKLARNTEEMESAVNDISIGIDQLDELSNK